VLAGDPVAARRAVINPFDVMRRSLGVAEPKGRRPVRRLNGGRRAKT
jgi:hypothetical protein